jgi:hypothetical protein
MDIYLLKKKKNEWRSLNPGVSKPDFPHIQLHHEFVYPKAFEINLLVMLKFNDN